MTTKICRTFLALLLLSLAGGLLATGCSSLGKPTSASFASVTITNQSVAQINDAAIAVFQNHGYQSWPTGKELVFEKEGTLGNTIAYSGPIGAHYGAVTIVRVRASVVELGNNVRRLQCQAYMVSNAGDTFMQQENRLSNFRSGPYQEILDEVASKLNQP